MNQIQASRQRCILVFLLFLHTLNTYMDRVAISSARTDGKMLTDIGMTDAEMGVAFGIFAIGYALFQIPAGWFSDKVGPRHALTIVVIIWSIFTAMTGAVWTAAMLIVVRFLFGVGEAGAYPGAARALYSWLPAKERGFGLGIFHSGARIGAAVCLALMPWVIEQIGWRWTFVVNALVGIAWGLVWWFWFRNNPRDHKYVNDAEADLIEQGIEEEKATESTVPYVQVVTSSSVLLAMGQYIASNVTAFFAFSWFQPLLVDTWGKEYRMYAAIPLLCGALALWASGYLVTFLHRRGSLVMSRRVPAMIGFTLGAIGLSLATQFTGDDSPWMFIACFSLAFFGVEMTLSPSWTFCLDIGGKRSGAVSAAMNMMGNLGAAASAMLFPLFRDQITLPWEEPLKGSPNSFFVVAAGINVLAVVAWLFMNPQKPLKEISPAAMKVRILIFAMLIGSVAATLVYWQFLRG